MERTSKRYENIINNIRAKNMDVSERSMCFEAFNITLLYIKQLTDRTALSEYVIRPLASQNGEHRLKAAAVLEMIYADDCMLDTDENKIEQYILDGNTVLLLSGDAAYIVINLIKVEKRSIPEPDTMYTLRGPNDSFIEDLNTNVNLIRYRLKNQNLRVERFEVGARTRTPILVIYFEDVANETCVNAVKKRISSIDVDALSSSGDLQNFMQNNKRSLFPQMGITERSDMACAAITEGKVVILMAGGRWALIAPKVFSEYLWSCDDFYMNKFYGTFVRILRVIALIFSFIVSSVYIAIVSYHPDVLPSAYMIAIAQARAQVPFNAFLEVLLIEIVAELIRESLIRVPTKIGTAIGIVGAIIIGQAAVAAGVFSPMILIVISLSLLSSFIPSDYQVVNAFRVLKFFLIFATGLFGFFGFMLVILFILANLVSINTFGVPYMAPIAPYNAKDFWKSVVFDKADAPTRPAFLRTKDKTRTGAFRKNN